MQFSHYILNKEKIKETFDSTFGDLVYDYSLITEEEKKNLITKYKKEKKYLKKKNVGIEDVINMKRQVKQAYQYYMNHREFKNNIDLMLSKYNNVNNHVITKLIVEIKIKKIKKPNNVYLFINDKTAINLVDKDNTPFFCDTSYYAVPLGANNY